ncbi:MAG: hypothetical protein U0869_03295 [Chloroflexota bacterium]
MNPAVKRFLDQLKLVEQEQAREMRQAWDVAPVEPRKAAWAKATAALKAAGRSDELDELREGVNTWAGDIAWNIIDQFGGHSPERARQDARKRAVPPVMDAGLAAITTDLLDQDERYLLTKPFRAALAGEAGRPRHSARSIRRSPAR